MKEYRVVFTDNNYAYVVKAFDPEMAATEAADIYQAECGWEDEGWRGPLGPRWPVEVVEVGKGQIYKFTIYSEMAPSFFAKEEK